ncbi:MAG: hypothetical protein WCP34_10035 [Pseudomonadota bacterium]
MIALEPLCALAANTMSNGSGQPKESENTITKALMVLSEQGLYAFGLFLATRKRKQDEEPAKAIHRAVCDLLAKAGLAPVEKTNSWPDYYRELTQQREGKENEATALRRVLLTKQVVEMALTYGRYHAKALGNASGS